MPFVSQKQRRYMHANHPEIAERWEHKYHGGLDGLVGKRKRKRRRGKGRRKGY